MRGNQVGKIKDIVAFMKQNATFEIGIEGFADPRGTDAYNQALRVRGLPAAESAGPDSGCRAHGPLSS